MEAAHRDIYVPKQFNLQSNNLGLLIDFTSIYADLNHVMVFK